MNIRPRIATSHGSIVQKLVIAQSGALPSKRSANAAPFDSATITTCTAIDTTRRKRSTTRRARSTGLNMSGAPGGARALQANGRDRVHHARLRRFGQVGSARQAEAGREEA